MEDVPVSTKYTEGEPEAVGEIPIRQELQTLKDEDGKPKEIGWSVYEVTGTDTYRIPEGTPAPTNITEAEALMVPENMVTTEDGLREGDRLIIQDLIGLNIGFVEIMKDGKPTAFSKSGKMMYMLEFVDDRPEPDAPPRWVCTGSGNIAAIQKLNLTT